MKTFTVNTRGNPEKVVRVLAMGLAVWMLPLMTVQAGDDYLSALEAEAGDTADQPAVSTVAVSHKQAKKVHHSKKNEVLTAGLDFVAFEAELDNNYSGSHSLYVKLSKDRRRQVFNTYREDNRVSTIREEIVRLLSSG